MYKKTKAWLMMSLLAAFVAGCGGGGGSGSGSGSADPPSTSQTLSGTAAEGAAISGSVYLKDKNGNKKTGTADGNGKYTIDVTDLSLPLLLKISSSNGVDYYSVATATGTANIHPFTDLIIRNWYKVKGSNVETDFSGSGALAEVPTAEEINTIEAVVRNVLATTLSALGVDPDSFNLITSSFDADSTKFDKLLDNSSVTIDDTGNVTVTVEDPDTGVSGTIISTEITTDIAATDAAAPSQPLNLATVGDTTKITLSWNSSTDNIGIAGYSIYRGGVNVGTSPYTGYIDSGLTASTQYCYQVEAFDAAGNLSNKSTEVCATTTSGSATTNPLVGSWYLGEFNAGEPGNITFRENGYYTVYADCSKQVEPVPNVDLEIGTYTYADGLLTITSHIQNGCGGFDEEGDATIPPVSPLNVTFNSDGSSMTLTLYGLTLAKVQDTASPIVGGWEIGTFDASDAHTVTFYKNGYYTVYTDCSKQVEPSPNVNLEIGTYTYADGLLTITSHIQNGCGGFDDESGTGIPPVDPLSISFSADKSAMTIVNYNLTFTRVE